MNSEPVLGWLIEDHTYIRRVFELFARELAAFAEDRTPNYDVLAGALDYLHDYLDAIHHPLEDRIVEHLKRHVPTSAESLAGLSQAHQDLETLSIEVTREFAAARDDAVAARRRLCERGRYLTGAYADHLAWEEARLFPLAQRMLTSSDWDAVLKEDVTAPNLSHALQVRNHFTVWLRGYDD